MTKRTPTAVHHPLFARLYERMAPAFEAKGGAAHRDEMLAGLAGRVVEVGAGTGLNFRHYPSTVTEVIAVEPEPYLRARADEAAATSEVPVTVVDGVADHLPLADVSCDAAVASLVLCSVPNQATALSELRRVVRSGGELRFYEHIRSAAPGLARLQRALDVVWPHFIGGCHTSRDTVAAIRAAGFVIDDVRHFSFRPAVTNAPVAPHVIGRAHRPATVQ